MNMDRKALGVIAEPSLIRFLPLVCAAGLAAVAGAEAVDGTLDLNGADRAVSGGLTGLGRIVNTSGTLATLTVDCGDGEAVFSGTISGNIVLVKTGAGTQAFTGANTHTGGTRVEGGFLAADSAAALGAKGAPLALCGGGLLARESLTVDTDSHAVTNGPGLATWRAPSGKTLSLSGAKFTVMRNTELAYDGGGQVSLGVWMAYDLGNLPSSTLTVGAGTTLLCQNALVLGGDIPKWNFAQTRFLDGSTVYAYGRSHLCNLEMTGSALHLWKDDELAAAALGTLKVLPSETPSKIVGKAFCLGDVYRPSTGGNDVVSRVDSIDVAYGATLEVNAALASRIPGHGMTKTGAGELRLLASSSLDGTCDVQGGALTLAREVSLSPGLSLVCTGGARIRLEDGALLAADVSSECAILRSADVWIDATRLDAADGEAVSRIANRGAAGGTFAAKTVGGVADIAPTLSADGINGLPSLAFDGTQSLHLGYTNKTEHFTLFAVYKWDAWEAAEDKGLWSGPFAFGAVQSAWAEDSNLPGAVAYYTKDGPRRIFGYANYANAAGGVVQTYIAADARSGATDDFATLLHEHEINGGETSMALGWDATDAEARDSTKSADVSSVAGFSRKIETMVLGARMMNSGAAYRNRMLNGKIGELLVFSRALTDAEKQSIRAYLKAKWFTASPASAPSAADTAEAAVAIEVPEQAAAFASGAFAGTAAVRKTGAGELAFGARAESAVAVAEGTLALTATQTVSRADIWIDPSDAATVTLDADGVHVAGLANKGRAGGRFGRAKSPATWKYDVAYPTLSANGLNGHATLSFDGLSALCMENAYVNNAEATHTLHVYAVLKRTAYADELGKGLYGGAWSFYKGNVGANDDAQSGSFFMTEKSNGDGMGGISMVQNGNVSSGSVVIKPANDPALTGKAAILIAHGAPASVYGTRLDAASDPDAPTVAGSFGQESLAPFDIDRVALGARGGNWDTVQIHGAGSDKNRSWQGEVGEFIAFTKPLSEAEERALVAHLRKKWLGVGDGASEPPAFLAGQSVAANLAPKATLSVGTGATLASSVPSCRIAALSLADGARVVREAHNAAASDYRLFDVAGDVSLSGTVRLNVSPRPREATPFVGYGTLSGSALWQREGGGHYTVYDRAAHKELWLACPAMRLLIR